MATAPDHLLLGVTPYRFDPVTDAILTGEAPGRPHGAVVAHVGHHPGFAERLHVGPMLAAALDLYAALAPFVVFKSGDSTTTITVPSEAIAAARAAIAKAEGRA